jgi:aldose 1-epimerase
MIDDSLLNLSDGRLRIVVRPAMGGGLARFDFVADGIIQPLFRPEPEAGARHPFELACNVLLPWSNRISGGGFTFEGRRYTLAPNLAGEPFPIHGNGFAVPWKVAELSDRVIELGLDATGPGPYRYAARLRYALTAGALGMALSVTNRGARRLPFGLGFHPWLVRTRETRLCAPAEAVWREDERHLPVGDVPVPIPPAWDFSTPVPLPDGPINNAFIGWSGEAEVVWPERGLRLAIAAAAPLGTAIVYSPRAAADFFCFEPVSHPVDAFNRPGSGGLLLGPGETARAEVRFAAEAS